VVPHRVQTDEGESCYILADAALGWSAVLAASLVVAQYCILQEQLVALFVHLARSVGCRTGLLVQR